MEGGAVIGAYSPACSAATMEHILLAVRTPVGSGGCRPMALAGTGTGGTACSKLASQEARNLPPTEKVVVDLEINRERPSS